MTTILDIVTDLYQADVIADYHRIPDGNIRCDLTDGTRVYVGPDFDPEHPERDADCRGYVWTSYTVEDGEEIPMGTGGDDTVATLADVIRKQAS
jgi:hypothetical protein